jgi:hypothetical protein
MIISDEHKYVFVELPWTASTAISKELCEHYGGRRVLRKHSNYREFLKYARGEPRKYFVFSGVRNPLSELVSIYVKYVTDHRANYSKDKDWVSGKKKRRYEWVQENGPSFAEFFLRFYRLPLENWSSLDHHRFDYVYRLENLQDDFAEILCRIGIQQVRSLPLVHRTEGKAPWQSYYTPEAHNRLRFVCGPYMERWGYEFPPEWNVSRAPWHSWILYWILVFAKNAVRRLRRVYHPPERRPWGL